MKTWVRHHVSCLIRTVRHFGRSPVSMFLNVLVIAITAAFPMLAVVLVTTGQALGGKLTRDPQLSVFFATDAARADHERVESLLKRSSVVGRFHFVSRDEALATLRKEADLAEAINALRSNPLPDGYVVHLRRDSSTDAVQLATDLRALPRVAHVQVESEWLRRLDGLMRIGRVVLGLLLAMIGVGLIAVTFNTVRQHVLAQAEEIDVCRLLGATTAYVRRPYLYLGAALGLVGGIVAIGLAFGAMRWLNREVQALAARYGIDFSLVPPEPGTVLLGVLAPAVLGLIGAAISVSYYLHQHFD